MQRTLEKNETLTKERKAGLVEVRSLPLLGPDTAPIMLLTAPQVGVRVPQHREINVAINFGPSFPLSSQHRWTLERVLQNGPASLRLTSSHSVHRTTETSSETGGQQSNATSISLAVKCEISVVRGLPAPGCPLVQNLSGSLNRVARARLRSGSFSIPSTPRGTSGWRSYGASKRPTGASSRSLGTTRSGRGSGSGAHIRRDHSPPHDG